MERQIKLLNDSIIVDIGHPIFYYSDNKYTTTKELAWLLVNDKELTVTCAYYANRTYPYMDRAVVAVECEDSNGNLQVYGIYGDFKIKNLAEISVQFKSYSHYYY